MNNGWISLYRDLLDNPIWTCSTPEQCKILITLLLMANHEPKSWEWQGQKFEVQAGQFITSLKSIAEKCGKGITIQNVRTALNRFEKMGFLTSKSTNKNRLITIVNWNVYQDTMPTTNKQTNKQLTSNQQATNKQLTTNNNDNNNNNIYKKEKETDFDKIINSYTENNSLKKEIYEFIKMRKTIKRPLTSRALQLMLSKLEKISNNDAEKIQILGNSIVNSWQGVFPLKNKIQKINYIETTSKDRALEEMILSRNKLNSI